MSSASKPRPSLDLDAHLVGPGLRAEVADPDRKVVRGAGRGQAPPRQGRARTTACSGEAGDAEVAHQRELAVGVAAGDRQHGPTEPLAAVVQAETAGEQPVAVGVLQHVAGLESAATACAR